MDTTKFPDRTFEFAINIKEKKVSLAEYIILKKAFLEGLQVTRDWLLNIKKNNPNHKRVINKVLRNINFESIDYETRLIESLRNDDTGELFEFLDSQVVPLGVRTRTSANQPKQPAIAELKQSIISKEELKKEINDLYQQKDNLDLCLNKTAELLQHPDLTQDEKNRYNNFYHELVEWINLKNKEQENAQRGSQSTPSFADARATSISALRSSMLKELQKLRDIYIDKEE